MQSRAILLSLSFSKEHYNGARQSSMHGHGNTPCHSIDTSQETCLSWATNSVAKRGVWGAIVYPRSAAIEITTFGRAILARTRRPPEWQNFTAPSDLSSHRGQHLEGLFMQHTSIIQEVGLRGRVRVAAAPLDKHGTSQLGACDCKREDESKGETDTYVQTYTEGEGGGETKGPNVLSATPMNSSELTCRKPKFPQCLAKVRRSVLLASSIKVAQSWSSLQCLQ